MDPPAERALVQKLTDGITAISATVAELEATNAAAREVEDPLAKDEKIRDEVLPLMEKLRAEVDSMEKICGHDYWPVPSYNKMLFYV